MMFLPSSASRVTRCELRPSSAASAARKRKPDFTLTKFGGGDQSDATKFRKSSQRRLLIAGVRWLRQDAPAASQPTHSKPRLHCGPAAGGRRARYADSTASPSTTSGLALPINIELTSASTL
jgi:hypothetical protein